ncbi:hypothetical protein BD560DRAFT_428515 [Blakeslea trispora]|nr:hypothetical protein BD560DRAFT_428515 [Blakeslea trispora]
MSENNTSDTIDNSAVMALIQEFTKALNVNSGITEDESCNKFMRGLSNRDTRSQVRQAQATTLREAIRVTIAHDSAIHENPSFHRRNVGAYNFNRKSTPRGPYAGEPMDLSMMSSSRGNVRCHYCDKVGHIRRHCKIRSEDIRKMEQKRYNELKKNHGAASSKDFH